MQYATIGGESEGIVVVGSSHNTRCHSSDNTSGSGAYIGYSDERHEGEGIGLGNAHNTTGSRCHNAASGLGDIDDRGGLVRGFALKF
jgi:hypothetical protein